MDDKDLFEDEECLQCDDCGLYYPKSVLRRCSVCGMVVCRNCRPKHKHRSDPPIRAEPIVDAIKSYGKSAFETAYYLLYDILELVLSGAVGILRYVGVLGVVGAVLVASAFLMFAIPFDDSGLASGFDDVLDFEPNPHIVPASEYAGMTESRTLYFDWRGRTQEVTADVDLSVYYGSLSDRSNVPTDDETWWTLKCLDSRQDEFYEDVLSDLRSIRDSHMLDSDEYVELIVSFVQSISYDYGALASARYPIAVFYEGRGDCDELSIFACGLLAKEGYDVALFDIPEEEHMSAGIKAYDSFGYVDGYIYVELTNPYLIGEVPYFDSGTPYADCYVVGEGYKQYLSYHEVEQIIRYRERFDDFMDDWSRSPNVDVGRYNMYVDNYNYIMGILNAGEREKAYSIVERYPLII